MKTRTAAAYQLRKMVLDLIPQQQSDSRRRWHDAFLMTGDGPWKAPDEWTGDPLERKAGVRPNPWLGCFNNPSWLDGWGRESHPPESRGHHWDVDRTKLGKLSAAAVLGCLAV